MNRFLAGTNLLAAPLSRPCAEKKLREQHPDCVIIDVKHTRK